MTPIPLMRFPPKETAEPVARATNSSNAPSSQYKHAYAFGRSFFACRKRMRSCQPASRQLEQTLLRQRLAGGRFPAFVRCWLVIIEVRCLRAFDEQIVISEVLVVRSTVGSPGCVARCDRRSLERGSPAGASAAIGVTC